MDEIKLHGKIIINGVIKAQTGIAIGGSTVGLGIGGVDNPVIKTSAGEPYIPGSSIKGKLRSLLEKAEGKPLTQKLGEARIHVCETKEEFASCSVCKIFGSPGEKEYSEPTRIMVRDAHLTVESNKDLQELPTDTDYTEVKYENVIDRITSAANPRQMERVPAGACFSFEFIYNVLSEEDKNMFADLLKTMGLLEHDYLGSSGSRGYGRITFENINVYYNTISDYETGNLQKESLNESYDTIPKILEHLDEITSKLN